MANSIVASKLRLRLVPERKAPVSPTDMLTVDPSAFKASSSSAVVLLAVPLFMRSAVRAATAGLAVLPRSRPASMRREKVTSGISRLSMP